MAPIDWDTFDTEELFLELRDAADGPDGEKMIWAFEEALRVARLDDGLLDYMLAATTCLLARVNGCAPRDVLELFFRRAISNVEWHERYRPLFD
jgi:hypothetical protein